MDINKRTFRSAIQPCFAGFLLTFLLLTSCREEDPQPVSEGANEVNHYVNSWILENMALGIRH